MGKSLKNMMGRLLIIALAVCFCDAAPTTDLVVPEYLDFAAFSKLAPTAFLQAVIKSGGTEAECRSFATTTINTISESVKSEGAILNAVDTGAGCASNEQELVQVAQGRLEAKEGVLAAKEGSAAKAHDAEATACTAAVDMAVGLDTLKKTTCYDYSSEASFISTDAACNQATIASSQAAAAVVSATTDVQYAQGEVQDAVAEAARLESGCLCRVHQEQAAAQVAAQTATTAHADDWKQAQEVLCAVDQTTPCPMPPCPTVTQPTATPTATPTSTPTATPTATPTEDPTNKYRFFRFNVQQNNGGFIWTIHKVKFYGVDGTALSLDPGRASASSTYTNPHHPPYPASNAFAAVGQYFSAHQVGWLQISFSTPTAVQSYSWARAQGMPFTPKDWNFVGSNDGVTWNILDSRQNVNVDEWTRKEAIATSLHFTCEDANWDTPVFHDIQGETYTSNKQTCTATGKQLCTYDQICPNGQGSPAMGGYTSGHNEGWAPIWVADGQPNDMVYIRATATHSNECRRHNKDWQAKSNAWSDFSNVFCCEPPK